MTTRNDATPRLVPAQADRQSEARELLFRARALLSGATLLVASVPAPNDDAPLLRQPRRLGREAIAGAAAAERAFDEYCQQPARDERDVLRGIDIAQGWANAVTALIDATEIRDACPDDALLAAIELYRLAHAALECAMRHVASTVDARRFGREAA